MAFILPQGPRVWTEKLYYISIWNAQTENIMRVITLGTVSDVLEKEEECTNTELPPLYGKSILFPEEPHLMLLLTYNSETPLTVTRTSL